MQCRPPSRRPWRPLPRRRPPSRRPPRRLPPPRRSPGTKPAAPVRSTSTRRCPHSRAARPSTRKIIKDGELSLVVDDLVRAIDRITKIAVDPGGYILSAELSTEGLTKTATVKLGRAVRVLRGRDAPAPRHCTRSALGAVVRQGRHRGVRRPPVAARQPAGDAGATARVPGSGRDRRRGAQGQRRADAGSRARSRRSRGG